MAALGVHELLVDKDDDDRRRHVEHPRRAVGERRRRRRRRFGAYRRRVMALAARHCVSCVCVRRVRERTSEPWCVCATMRLQCTLRSSQASAERGQRLDTAAIWIGTVRLARAYCAEGGAGERALGQDNGVVVSCAWCGGRARVGDSASARRVTVQSNWIVRLRNRARARLKAGIGARAVRGAESVAVNAAVCDATRARAAASASRAQRGAPFIATITQYCEFRARVGSASELESSMRGVVVARRARAQAAAAAKIAHTE